LVCLSPSQVCLLFCIFLLIPDLFFAGPRTFQKHTPLAGFFFRSFCPSVFFQCDFLAKVLIALIQSWLARICFTFFFQVLTTSPHTFLLHSSLGIRPRDPERLFLSIAAKTLRESCPFFSLDNGPFRPSPLWARRPSWLPTLFSGQRKLIAYSFTSFFFFFLSFFPWLTTAATPFPFAFFFRVSQTSRHLICALPFFTFSFCLLL